MVQIKKFRIKSKRLTRSVGGNLMMFFFIACVGALMALPLVYSVITAFKPINEIFIFPPRFYVQHPTFENFGKILTVVNDSWVPLGRYVLNSVFVTFVGTVSCVFIDSLAAYPLAKHTFYGKKTYNTAITWTILFRSEVTGVIVYIILAFLGMINTYWSMLLPALASSFGVFLMRQFIVSFPDTVLEAARIDGAGEWKIFGSILMPSVKPGWITLIIFTFQTFWNTTGVNYVYDEKLRLLPAVLSQITGSGIARAGEASAVALLLMIPPIVIFVIAQNSVLETMAQSGIKE
jgi:ABC-type glycerol-3-phosphate transport system permease component